MERTIGPVTAATTGGAALTTLVCWVLARYGVDVPADVQGSLTILVVLISGWLVPSRSGDHAA